MLSERMLARRARLGGQRLPPNYWLVEPWAALFASETRQARLLLHRFGWHPVNRALVSRYARSEKFTSFTSTRFAKICRDEFKRWYEEVTGDQHARGSGEEPLPAP
jgi:hypothetical protein